MRLGRYERLREAAQAYSGPYGEYMMLLPDLAVLVTRLMFDRRVEVRHKAYLGVALAYVLSPIDLIPERLVGPAGYLDDLAVLVSALNLLLKEVDPALLQEHWSGRADLLPTVQQIVGQADQMIGKGRFEMILDRLRERWQTVAGA